MSNMDDLSSGKIIIKVTLGKEIKKVVIHTDDISYNELVLMMQRIFADEIKQTDEFTIKYTDEENDLITMSNDLDCTLALQGSKILKLTLFLKETRDENVEINPAEIVKELKQIRQSIDRFLDNLEKSMKIDKGVSDLSKKVTGDLKLNGQAHQHQQQHVQAPPSVTQVMTAAASHDLHREFDPLATRAAEEAAKKEENSAVHTLTVMHTAPPQEYTQQHPQQYAAPPQQQQSFSPTQQLQQQQHYAPAPQPIKPTPGLYQPQMTGATPTTVPPSTPSSLPDQAQQAYMQQQQSQQQHAMQHQFPPHHMQQQPQVHPTQFMGQQQQPYQPRPTGTPTAAIDPYAAQQQLYQQQQQQKQGQYQPGGQPPTGYSQPGIMMGAGNNPYSKNPTLQRPPSTTLQGYK